jgi:hypothetical protein
MIKIKFLTKNKLANNRNLMKYQNQKKQLRFKKKLLIKTFKDINL